MGKGDNNPRFLKPTQARSLAQVAIARSKIVLSTPRKPVLDSGATNS
ncbi:MAG: hypothetical protein KME01_15505 [Chroococcus sp. CMT-3BRIN-NPC107]|nr:hypothetical protein [Chroococcus sp. CMT-3BRIN-NPC107]